MSKAPYFSRALRGFIELKLKLVNLTGLLVRMPLQAQAYRIGGADQYPMVTRRVYRVHRDREMEAREVEVPYIPGSSIKGRMRSLLELALGLKLYTTDQKIWQHVRSIRAMGGEDFARDVEARCIVDELFGWAAANYSQILEAVKEDRDRANRIYSLLAPTRLLVEDFFPSEDYVREHDVISVSDFLEEKSENRIDRITSAADPRDIVRVKPNVEFEGRITLLLFDNDTSRVKAYLDALGTGLKLIEKTYLGASGSRGYGRVRFTEITLSLYKVVEENGVPIIKQVAVEPKELKSVDELLEKTEEVAKAIEEKLFKVEAAGSG